LNITQTIVHVLDDSLGLHGRLANASRNTPLLGAIPELDSMAVVALIATIEERFGLVVDYDDIDGTTFATLGSLSDFVSSKVSA
jgi:acyl carrier protein